MVQDAAAPMNRETRYFCPGHAQDFLQAVGTDAPACRMVMPGDVPLVQAFIDNGRWTPEEADKARMRLTTVYKLCDWVSVSTFSDAQVQQTLLAAVQGSLSMLLEVCVTCRLQKEWHCSIRASSHTIRSVFWSPKYPTCALHAH